MSWDFGLLLNAARFGAFKSTCPCALSLGEDTMLFPKTEFHIDVTDKHMYSECDICAHCGMLPTAGLVVVCCSRECVHACGDNTALLLRESSKDLEQGHQMHPRHHLSPAPSWFLYWPSVSLAVASLALTVHAHRSSFQSLCHWVQWFSVSVLSECGAFWVWHSSPSTVAQSSGLSVL